MLVVSFPSLTLKLSIGEIAKKLGEVWKSLSKEEKNRYRAMYDADMERYKREKEKEDRARSAGTDSF